MADYTVSTTQRQEKVLAYLLTNVINPRRVANNQNPINKAQFIQLDLNNRLDDFDNQAVAGVNNDRAQKFAAASQSVQDQIDAILGTIVP